MGRRSNKGEAEAGFDSFTDILTCLAGILVLIIILIVIQAQQTKIFIPTPAQRVSDKIPVYFECTAEGEFFPVPYNELIEASRRSLNTAATKAGTDTISFLKVLSKPKFDNPYYNLDTGYLAAGYAAIDRKEDVAGERFEENIDVDKKNTWLHSRLLALDPSTQMLTFIVRSSDESILAFKKARVVGWVEGFEVGYDLLERDEAIKFGLGGRGVAPQ